MKSSITRRHFLKAAGIATGGAATSAPIGAEAGLFHHANKIHVRDGDVILFQGDSITDMGRSREKAGEPNAQPGMGNGYAWLAAAELLVDRKGSGLKIFNRGISGNKVYQLAERWDTDCLALRPDVLSVLIGVNDLWHKLNGKYAGTLEIYERDYRMLLERTKKALPHVKLVLCEPFVLRCGAVSDKWFPEFNQYRAAAKRVADAFDAVFVPFQSMFDEAVKYAPPAHWAADGVHPTPSGASLMAHEWLDRTTD
jgi:lysophospholipase L1-like esterase